ncbi:MAG: ComE-like competence protein [Acidobacteria bacterium]|nr:ComE-like competence protein [Acidobacteriota bacterium]
MHHDAPAALPLIGFAAGLASGTLLVNPRLAVVGLLAMALLLLLGPIPLRFKRAAVLLALGAAAGLMLALHEERRVGLENEAFTAIDAERFVTIEAPLDRQWAARGDAYVLRLDRFTANGVVFTAPLTLYARFAPPPFGLEATVRADGFLRRSEDGRYSVSVKSPHLLSYRGELPRLHPARWNRLLAMRLEPLASSYPTEVALVEALALGRSERLSRSLREGFRRGGTYHLLVFSGMQIAVAAALIALLLRTLHAPRASDWCLLVFAVLAPPFIGPTASVARAGIGIGLYAFSRILRRPTSLENLWCVAALARLVVAPSDLSNAAFHLTYAGAGAMIFMARPLMKRRRWIAGAGAAELSIAPLTLFHFHQFALGGSLVTVAMTPLIFGMMLLSALVLAFPNGPFLAAIGLLHTLCIRVNAIGALSSGFYTAPPRAALIAGFALATLAIASLRGKRRAGAMAMALTIPTLAAIVLCARRSDAGGEELVMLDVGQGDSIVARSGAHTLLVDGGGRADDLAFGETTLLPLLVDRGIRHIDVVLLSHAHPDHCGGLPAAVRELDVGQVWISPRRFRGVCAQQLLAACSESATPIHLVRDGDRVTVGAIHLVAMTSDVAFRRSPENNSSVAARLQIGRRRVLLTGDIERDAEAHLADRDVRADVLKVAHHGSHSSSTGPMLEAVAPRLALISCGRHNLFGHPHPEVVAALAARGIRTWRTDQSGAVSVRFAQGELWVRGEIDTPP